MIFSFDDIRLKVLLVERVITVACFPLVKMMHLDLLTPLDETTWPTAKREAKLFSFNPDKYNELKQNGFRLEF